MNPQQRKKLLLIPLVLCLLPGKARAIINVAGTNQGPREFVRRIPDISALKRAGLSAPAIARAMGTTGTKKVAVILVNFPSAGSSSGGHTMSAEDMSVYIDDAGTFLTDFYKNASYGKLNLQVAYLWNGGSGTSLAGTETPYTANNSLSYYGNTVQRGLDLIKEILGKCPAANSSDYDFVLIVHAGYGEEFTGVTGDIWSVNYGLSPAVNGFEQCALFPARESDELNGSNKRRWSTRGVWCHEFGHELGLPDLYDPYDTTGYSSRIGNWCLMDSGSWGIDSQWRAWFPAYPSAFCREMLGWVTPREIAARDTITSLPVETCDNSGSASSLYKVLVADNPDEYFLICTSTRAYYYDATLGTNKSMDAPGEGLLIWHIDKGVIDGHTYAERLDDNALNSYSHKTTDLEQADTSDPSANGGDAADPWRAGAFSTDRSASYAGAARVVISSIQFSAESAAVQARTSMAVFNGYYYLSGTVADSLGTPVNGAQVSVAGDSQTYVTADQSGGYSFLLFQGSYTVSSSRPGYSFVPDQQSVSLTADTRVDFSAFRATHTVNGIVLDSSGRGISAVTVSVAGDTQTYAVTDHEGRARFSLFTGDYAITPSKEGYRFVPDTYSLSLSSAGEVTVAFTLITDGQYRSVAGGEVKLINNVCRLDRGEKTNFIYKTSAAGETKVAIYSLSGALVQSSTYVGEAGINSASWDGRTGLNEEVASGIYLVTINGPGIRYQGKVCIIR